jgi:hypothetical protein
MRFFLTLAAGTLLMINGAAGAPPTGTVYRLVQMDTNGVFVNLSTNIIAANGIARTGTVADAMAAHLLVTNPHAITPAMISAATAAQGAKADTAVQPTSQAPGLILDITTVTDTNTLIVAGAGETGANGSYTLTAPGTFEKGTYAVVTNAENWVLTGTSGLYTFYALTGSTPTGTWSVVLEGSGPAPTTAYTTTSVTTNTGASVSAAAMKITDAIWKTNQVLALDGSTNTIVFLGLP